MNAPPTIKSIIEGETAEDIREEDQLFPASEIFAEGLPDAQALLVCPFNGYNLCPTGVVATTPGQPEDITNNPLGTCRCDGELWLAEGCKYGFYCDSSMEDEGQYLYCDDVSLLN